MKMRANACKSVYRDVQ